MARPKERPLSQAFYEKSDAEYDKLTQALATQLRADMQRLLEEGEHSDITLVLNGASIKIHSPLLKIRAPGFYKKYIENNPDKVIRVEQKDADEVKQLIRFVYTKDDLPFPHWVSGRENIGNSGHSNNLDKKMPAQTNSSSSDEQENVPEEDKENSSIIESIGSPPDEHLACCTLGNDLLCLHQSTSTCDVVLQAKGNTFSAHKFVLCARSSYFEAMLGGSWKESQSQEIALEGVSAAVLGQAISIIYGGMAGLTSFCDVGELVRFADMYGIAGIKDVTTYLLRRDYCHFFHKPCSGCLSGLCEALVLSMAYGLAELEERCLRWSSKNFVRLWPTKSFALLPQEVLEKCCKHLIADITSASVLDTIMEIDKLRGAMPQVRWADPVVEMIRKVTEACIKYLSSNVVNTVHTQQFMALGTKMAFVLELVEGVFNEAIDTMPVQIACKTYLECKRLNDRTLEEDCDWTEDFKSLLQAMYKTCNHFMHHNVHLLVATQDWNLLPEKIQIDIKKGGWYVPTNDGTGPKPKAKRKISGSLSARPNQLPTKKRPRNHPGSSSKSPTPVTPGSAGGSALSTGHPTPKTPDSKKGHLTTPNAGTSSKDAKKKSWADSSSHETTRKTQAAGKSQGRYSTSESSNVTDSHGPKKSTENKKAKDDRPHLDPSLPTSTVNERAAEALPISQNRQENKENLKVVNQTKHKIVSSMPIEKKSKLTRPKCSTASGQSEPTGQIRGVKRHPTHKLDTSKANMSSSDPSSPRSGASSSTSSIPSPRSAGTRPRHTDNGPALLFKRHSMDRNTPDINKVTDEVYAECTSLKVAALEKGQRHNFSTDNDLETESVISMASHTAVLGSRTPSLCDMDLINDNDIKSKLNSQPKGTRSNIEGKGQGQTRRVPQSNKNTEEVYAKCTSMRISAMKKNHAYDCLLDNNLDIETESIVSMMSNVAVQGSRSPSPVNLSTDITDGSTKENVSSLVKLASPKIFTNVIVPILNTTFNSSPKVR